MFLRNFSSAEHFRTQDVLLELQNNNGDDDAAYNNSNNNYLHLFNRIQ
jgi:hypothetical protein